MLNFSPASVVAHSFTRSSAANGSMSAANVHAIEQLGYRLKLYVRPSISLTSMLSKSAGGFMTFAEAQRVTSQPSESEQMDVLLKILCEKDDDAFEKFVELLGRSNYKCWGDELKTEVRKFTGGLAPSPVAQQQDRALVTGSSTADARVQQLESEVEWLLAELQSTRSRLCRSEREVKNKEYQIARQAELIKTFASEESKSSSQEKDATIANQADTIAQLRHTIAQMQQTQGGPLQRQPASISTANSSGAEVESAGEYRLQKARTIFQDMQKKPLITSAQIAGVIDFYLSSLKFDDQLCDQIAPLIAWVVSQPKGFVNRTFQNYLRGLSPVEKVEQMLTSFCGHFYWTEDLWNQEHAIAAWVMLLEGLNKHGCFNAADMLLRGLENVAQGRAAGRDA